MTFYEQGYVQECIRQGVEPSALQKQAASWWDSIKPYIPAVGYTAALGAGMYGLTQSSKGTEGAQQLNDVLARIRGFKSNKASDIAFDDKVQVFEDYAKAVNNLSNTSLAGGVTPGTVFSKLPASWVNDYLSELKNPSIGQTLGAVGDSIYDAVNPEDLPEDRKRRLADVLAHYAGAADNPADTFFNEIISGETAIPDYERVHAGVRSRLTREDYATLQARSTGTLRDRLAGYEDAVTPGLDARYDDLFGGDILVSAYADMANAVTPASKYINGGLAAGGLAGLTYELSKERA